MVGSISLRPVFFFSRAPGAYIASIVPWSKIDPAEQMYEYACREDNYDIVHLLSGARIREKNGETAPPAGSIGRLRLVSHGAVGFRALR